MWIFYLHTFFPLGFWLSDKTLIQQELAANLAHIMLELPDQRALLYFKAGMATLRREWTRIDHLRFNHWLPPLIGILLVLSASLFLSLFC